MMNPITRSALAIAATCGVVAVAPVVGAAPQTSVDASTATDALPPALTPTDTTPDAPCPPTDSVPVTTTVPSSSPTDPTVPATTVPATTVPETTTTTVPAAPAGLVTPGDPGSLGSVPSTSTPTDPCDTTTTTVPVPTDTTPPTTVDPNAPTTVAPPASEVPASEVPAVPVDTVPVTTAAVTEVPAATPPAEAPVTETTTTIAEASVTAVEEPQAEGAPVEVAPGEASTPSAPLPPINPSWTSQGVPRFVLPSLPGSTALQPGRTPAGERVVLAENVDVILATIRQLESGNRYDIGPNKALASGAYQYIPGTWNNYGGYAEAYLAPPEVQDERARADVERFLTMYGGNVAMVPVMWYYPRAAIEPLWMDRVPNPAGGNRLTIREYQTLWLEKLDANASAMLGTFVATPETPAALSVVSKIPMPTTTAPVDPAAADAATAAAAAAAPTTVPPTTVPPTTVPPTTVPPAVAATEVDPATVPPTETPTTVAPTTTIPPPRIVADEITVSGPTMELATRSVPPAHEPTGNEGPARTIVFPVLGPVAYANGWMDSRDGGRRRHEGTDIVGVQMQPILAAVDGEITRLQTESIGIRGVAITIRDSEGWRYNYFHDNNDTPGTDDGQAADAFRLAPGLVVGSRVVAGQIIGYMGDSGNAEDSVTHLHFEFRDPDGFASPSFWSLKAAEARQACTIGIGPWSTPVLADEAEAASVPQATDATADATIEAALIAPNALVSATNAPGATDGSLVERTVEHTVVTPLFGEGQWVIDSDGRVTATGDAALILPRRDLQCDPGPATPFGTDAAGWRQITSGIVDGTVLEGADLSRTILAGVVPAPEPPVTDAAIPTAAPATEAPATEPATAALANGAPIVPATPIPTSTSAGLWPTGAGTAPTASPLPMLAPSALSGEETAAGGDAADGDRADGAQTEPIGEPLAFVDTATGETVIVRFERPLRPDRLIGPR